MKRTLTGIAAAALLLSACGDMNLKKYNPFGGDPVQERSRTPANATEYQCAGGKRIYVRTLDGGQAQRQRGDDRRRRTGDLCQLQARRRRAGGGRQVSMVPANRT